MIKRFSEKYKSSLYLIFRVLVGFMFTIHGLQKITSLFGGSSMSIASSMGFFGLFEILVGLAILLGFFTRLAALGGSILMIIAFFKVHFPNGWIPNLNGGELAVMYFISFLIILTKGAGKFSLERALLKREIF